MNFGEALRFSVQSLRGNPIRSLLTCLGMLIGNASVILVVTIAQTSQDYILEQIRGLGSNIIYAYFETGGQSVGDRRPISSSRPTSKPFAPSSAPASSPRPA